MFRPRKAWITRDGADANHARLQRAEGMIAMEPHVGDSLQVFLDTGKVMRTSPVTRVAQDGEELVVETANSRYRLKLAA